MAPGVRRIVVPIIVAGRVAAVRVPIDAIVVSVTIIFFSIITTVITTIVTAVVTAIITAGIPKPLFGVTPPSASPIATLCPVATT
jgi:hypothetical protein